MANDKGHRLTPEDLEKAIEMLRAGNRQAAIAKYFGVSSVAFFNRRADDPDGFGLRWSRAEAEGEIAARQALEDAAKDGRSTAPYQWILEHRYGWSSPVNRARIEELRARTAASKPAPAADVQMWAEMVSMIPGRRQVALAQKPTESAAPAAEPPTEEA